MKERLHKYLAHCGIASRRKCEQLILEGRVAVDGKTVTELGVQVDPDRQKIRLDGERVRLQPKVYFLVHKPAGVECTQGTPQGMRRGFKRNRRLTDLLPPMRERVYSVGRLDHDSEGIILVTNDGDLCQRLTHPRYRIPRTYHVVLEGCFEGPAVEKIQKGVWLSDGKTGESKVLIKKRARDVTVLEITIHEGMNREVRRIFAKVGFKVRHLKRIRFGPLELGNVGRGRFRPLTGDEIRSLRNLLKPPAEVPGRQEGWTPARGPGHVGASERPSVARHGSPQVGASESLSVGGLPDSDDDVEPIAPLDSGEEE